MSLLLRPTRPSRTLGIVVAAACIVAETLLTYVLKPVAPESSLGVIYLLGVLAVSVIWGLGLGLATAIASGLAFDFFHLPPFGTLEIRDKWAWAPLPIFLIVALITSLGASLMRSLALDADRRRQEADLARDELGRIASEQAALRRVATLVARGVSAAELFGSVAFEVGLLLKADCTAIARYEPDRSVVVTGSWSDRGPDFVLPLGSRWPLEERSVSALVLRTRRPARVTDYDGAGGEMSAWIRERGIGASVGTPIIVEARLWGVIVAGFLSPEPEPDSTCGRMLDFTKLVATAISNAEARDELAASRARVIAAADDTRRRIERDLHDGAQQRLVSLGLELRAAEATVPPELVNLKAQLSHTVQGMTGVLEELQELSRGIHPAILSKGGIGPALKMLSRRSAVPVELSLHADRRLPERVEAAAYYVVAEALTNIAKHAQASVARVDLSVDDSAVRISVRDDGIGGADPGNGSGLVGLRDRVQALGGSMEVTSPAGTGTSLVATVPLGTVPLGAAPME
ncbi:DUF4118 domain-containing protein [Planotetraspora sp. GP83]|uniref:sensor histidine kinase n=1 Tax=Planotetraspora sp. GP83 TaxID=3156264 RepID=UPI003518FA7F